MAKTIDDYKKDWAAANAAGDTKAMEAAHAGAEALRAAAGYSGGADGSQYIPLSTTTTAPAPTMPSGFSGSATGVGVNSNSQASIIQQMNENSKKWYTATTQEEKDALHAQNQQLAAQLGGSVSYDSKSGTWSGSAGTAVNNVGNYNSNYSTQIDSLLNSILNRQPFSYDYKTDPSYLAYEDKYKRLGDRAREDTLGNVAALNGGYASSWATTAASQAQNDYNQQLSDVIPTLYDAAYNRYLTEDNLDRSDLNLLMGMDDMYYGRYRDTVGDAQWQASFDRGAYESDRAYNYGVDRDAVADAQWEKSFDRDVLVTDRAFDWQVYTDKWNMSNTEATQKFDQLMTKWQLTGVADEEVAAELGVPVGATTESYYFNKASQELNEAKFEYQKEQDKKTGSGGGNDSFVTDKNKSLVLNEAKKKIKGTSQGNYYDDAIEYILSVAEQKGIDMKTFYSMCEELGASEDVIDKVYLNYEGEMLADEAAGAVTKDYLYYAGLMGQQKDPEAWLEANKYSIPYDIYENLASLNALK